MNTKIESLPRPRLRALHAAGAVVADRNGFSPKPTPFEAKPLAALQAGTIISRHVGRFEADSALRELPARVRKGQRVATINALGNAHAVLAPFDGIVTEMLTSCGQPCEYGQPVLRMAPA